MEKSLIFRLGVLILFLHVIAPVIHSQVIEVTGGVGYTHINLDSWTKGGELYDWLELNGCATAQGFYPINKIISVGISGGFHHLFSYSTKSPYGNYIGYNYEANAGSIAALARFNFGRNFIDLGVGPFFISGGYTDWAAVVSLGHAFRLTEKLSLPLKFNGSVIFDSDANIIPLTFTTGLSYRIK
ncbi:MAG: hypothetical protein MUO72_11900 [Bacteroidales bacterium]|nr:hypothetical protein [Bacteroidales bacterium]